MDEELENNSDWDTEEFQAALKTILKFEIQTLLNRLSETGEETVLLTVNTVDMCVSHLASSNAQRFVNSVDIGQVKSKFLQFVTGKPSSVSGVHKPLLKSDLDCGAYSDSEVNSQGKWDQRSASKYTGKRVLESKDSSQELQNSVMKRRKVEETPQNLPQFRQGGNVTPAGVKPVQGGMSATIKTTDKTSKLTPDAGPSDGDNTREKLQDKGKLDIKLNTTKIVSKSGGFTEERLSDKEFKNLLKMCNSDVDEDDLDESIDEDDLHPAQHSVAFSSQPGRMQQPPYVHSNPNQIRPGGVHGVTSKLVSSNPKSGPNSNSMVAAVRSNPELKPRAQTQDLRIKGEKENFDKSANMAAKPRNSANTDFTKEDGGAIRKPASQTVTGKDNGSSEIVINPILNIKEEVDPTDSEYRQNDPVKSHIGASQDKQQTSRGPDLKQSIQDKENRTQGPQTSNVKDGKLNTPATNIQRIQRAASDDDLDTETLIKMAKAKHKEMESEADRAIQAKLGQLSSKLSWVVEYPKDKRESQNPFPMENPLLKQGMGKPYPVIPGMEDDDEDEEDYDEDFDEELDEEELAALKAFQENKLKQFREGTMEGFNPEGSDGFSGNLRTIHNMGYHEDFADEEGEEEEFEGYPFNPEDMEGDEEGDMEEDGGMEHMGNYVAQRDMGSSYPDNGNQNLSQQQQYQRVSSPTLDNFLLMGPIMAKCLVCNRIVRKSEMKQHNQTHLEEEEEAGYEEEGAGYEGEEEGYEGEEVGYEGQEEGGYEGEEAGGYEGEEGDWVEDGEEGHGQGHGLEGGQEYGKEEGQEDTGQGEDNEGNGEGEEYEEEMPAEFVAERFVAEKIELGTETAGKGKKSTVCDICDKQFKSVGNMQRHRKIHTDSTHDCPHCDKTFRHPASLTSHIKRKHPDCKPNQDKQYAEAAVDKAYHCGICLESFADEPSLVDHVKTHTK